MTVPTQAEENEAIAVGGALVNQFLDDPQMVVDVVNGLTLNELRTVLIGVVGATATIVRDGL